VVIAPLSLGEMKYLILMLLFSFFGVGTEVFFTSIHDYLKSRDISLKGRSYLWMFLVYGAYGLIISPLYNAISDIHLFLRALVYTAVIFSGELGFGLFFKLILKKCPWEYPTGKTIKKVVKLNYLPFWFVFGIASEYLYRGFIYITVFE
jgi:hypothetical protein